jgi:hypothetical protein
VRLPLLTGKVVVCDRYTADAAVEIAGRLGVSDPMSVPAVRVLMALAPAPDSAYLLDLPAEVAAFRTADPEDVWAMLGQRKLYRHVADANDRLVRRALQEYEDNFATLTNGLLLSNPSQLNPGESAMSPPNPRPTPAAPPARRPPEPPMTPRQNHGRRRLR